MDGQIQNSLINDSINLRKSTVKFTKNLRKKFTNKFIGRSKRINFRDILNIDGKRKQA